MPDQVVDIDQLKGLRNLAMHRFHEIAEWTCNRIDTVAGAVIVSTWLSSRALSKNSC